MKGVVAVVALRQLRPRSAGGPWALNMMDDFRRLVAPLHAALLVAARPVPPPHEATRPVPPLARKARWVLSRCDKTSPRSAGDLWRVWRTGSTGEFIAPLDAALLVAARPVPPHSDSATRSTGVTGVFRIVGAQTA